MPKIDELQAQKNALYGDIRKLADRQAEWNAEDRANWKRLNDDYNVAHKNLGDEREALTENEAVQARLTALETENREASGDRRIGLDDKRRRQNNPERQAQASDEDRALCLQAYARCGADRPLKKRHLAACKRTGFNPRRRILDFRLNQRAGDPAWTVQGAQLRREIRAGLDTATSTAGPETVPQGFMAELSRKLVAFGGPRSVCRIVNTDTGAPLPWPTANDTGNSGELLADAASIGTSVDPATAAVTFNAYKYSSKPCLISHELLEDSAFDMAALLGDLLGTRIGRKTGVDTTTGDGSAKPNGIVTASTAGLTAASATAIAADEVIALYHKVDPAWRSDPSFGFMMHDNILLYLRKLKDANGVYLWQAGMSASAPDRLLGAPLTINQHMASAVTTGLKTMLCGAFGQYIIRDVGRIRLRRLDELYAGTDQVGFVAFMRTDGDLLQATAVQRLTQG